MSKKAIFEGFSALVLKSKILLVIDGHPLSPTVTHDTHGVHMDLPWRSHSNIRKIVDLAAKYVYYAKVMEAL